jgi:hypothetical protein
MPGIITHNFLFHEAVDYLKKKKYRTFLSTSIETLFNTDYYKRAALFGAIGPNIFDYSPFRRNRSCGSRLSFMLHDGGSAELLSTMLDKAMAHSDFNTEWAATQRAYLYGFISHIIADAHFHPFMLYWSGFPDSPGRREAALYREQNLIFQYNLDNFFLHYYKEGKFKYDLESMLPVKGGFGYKGFDSAVKDMLLGSLHDVFPHFAKRFVWKRGNNPDTAFSNSLGYIDLSRYFITLTYRLKHTRNERLKKMIQAFMRNRFVYLDLLVRYPEPRQLNRHVLNHHRARWVHPAGIPGIRYDSVEDILRICTAQIGDIWEEIEGMVYGKTENYNHILKKICINAFTGDEHAGYSSLKIKEPVKLRF